MTDRYHNVEVPPDKDFCPNAGRVAELEAEVAGLREVIAKAAKAATEPCSSWQFRGGDWRDGYMANGRMLADFLTAALEGRP